MDKKPPLRKVLAARLAEWMAKRPDLETQMKLEAASGVGQTSIGRILRADVSPTLDVLEKLAGAFGREVSDLVIQPGRELIDYDRAKYERLPDYEKARIEGFIKHAISQYEGNATTFETEVTPVNKAEVMKANKRSLTSPSAMKKHDAGQPKSKQQTGKRKP